MPSAPRTEAADTRLVIGLEGRGNTGLSYRLGHLHVDVHVVRPPLRHTPHRQVCRTEAPRTSSAVSAAALRHCTAYGLTPRASPVAGNSVGGNMTAVVTLLAVRAAVPASTSSSTFTWSLMPSFDTESYHHLRPGTWRAAPR